MLGPVLKRVKNYSRLSLRQGSKMCIFASWTGTGFRWVGRTPHPPRQMIILTNSHYITHTFAVKRLGERNVILGMKGLCTFWTWERVKLYIKACNSETHCYPRLCSHLRMAGRVLPRHGRLVPPKDFALRSFVVLRRLKQEVLLPAEATLSAVSAGSSRVHLNQGDWE